MFKIVEYFEDVRRSAAGLCSAPMSRLHAGQRDRPTGGHSFA
jgi:hypothetical protein